MDSLDLHNIQGHILPGFLTDFQILLFLRIRDAQLFKLWLLAVLPHITTASKEVQYQLLRKAAQKAKTIRVSKAIQIGMPRQKVTAIQNETDPLQLMDNLRLSIAFSYRGLEKLATDADQFRDQAFKEGMAERYKHLGDSRNKSRWKVGGRPKVNEADALIIVAGNDKAALCEEARVVVERLKGAAVKIHCDLGNHLPGRQEHFGFKDAISQPGLRGFDLNKASSDLVWPGEFLFGYPGQNSQDLQRPGAVSKAGPAWSKDGSFLVFRRLKQDVPGFWSFLRKQAEDLRIAEEFLAEKFVGRRMNGIPLIPRRRRASSADPFSFKSMDPHGYSCPFASHIRKSYPRDDEAYVSHELVNLEMSQTHRLLRRGIPYGLPYPHANSTDSFPDDLEDRGLLFMCYQTSIVNQFEHVMKHMNDPDFKVPGAGVDPLIGRNKSGRRFRLTLQRGDKPKTLTLPKQPWVTPTGGGYFFVPSIEALQETLSQ